MTFTIADLPLGAGRLGICPMPGGDGRYDLDLATLIRWQPGLVLTMTGADELRAGGAERLPADLAGHGIAWHHLPVADYGVPGAQTMQLWPAAAQQATNLVARGGRVLVHCRGGCGRSGMAVLRLMVMAGEDPQLALARLRAVRPCAVETEAQRRWAMTP